MPAPSLVPHRAVVKPKSTTAVLSAASSGTQRRRLNNLSRHSIDARAVKPVGFVRPRLFSEARSDSSLVSMSHRPDLTLNPQSSTTGPRRSKPPRPRPLATNAGARQGLPSTTRPKSNFFQTATPKPSLQF